MKSSLFARASALSALCLFVLATATLAYSQAPAAAAHNASCSIDNSQPSDGEVALNRGDFTKADTLLTAAAAAKSDDKRSRYLEIDVLIGQGKLADAQKKADAWTTVEPKEAYAILSASEVRFAEGDWLESYALALKALTVNPCLADAYQDLYIYEYRSGFRATAHRHIALAHQLAPNNQGIRYDWITSLPQHDYLAELQKYVEDSKTMDAKRKKKVFAQIQTLAGREENHCSLASSTGPAVIPMVPIYDTDISVGVKSWGIEVAFNGKKRTLQIDTGASGFTLVQSTGAALGLPKIERQKVGGIGDEGSAGTVLAKAASVHIAGLEFKNCEVDILDRTGAMGDGGALPGERLDATDGLIGADVFEHYLVTVDYIRHEFRLAPLPQAPANPVPAAQLDALGGSTNPDWLAVDRYVDPSMQSWTKIYREGHMLITPARLTDGKNSGSNHLFIIDTGADSNLVDIATARSLTHTEENQMVSMGGLSGKVNKIFEAGKFTIDFGGLRLPVKSMDSLDLSDFPGISGFLGYPTLEQLVMHIDYRDNLVLFQAPNGKKM